MSWQNNWIQFFKLFSFCFWWIESFLFRSTAISSSLAKLYSVQVGEDKEIRNKFIEISFQQKFFFLFTSQGWKENVTDLKLFFVALRKSKVTEHPRFPRRTTNFEISAKDHKFRDFLEGPQIWFSSRRTTNCPCSWRTTNCVETFLHLKHLRQPCFYCQTIVIGIFQIKCYSHLLIFQYLFWLDSAVFGVMFPTFT